MPPLSLPDLRQRLRDDIDAAAGRHDEPEIYDGPPGDPGLCGGPGSVSWEVNGDLAAITAGGAAAIVLELLHPSVMAGVAEHSSYRSDPLGRARNTLGFVLRTTFGTTEAATEVIEHVKHVHGFVHGVRPDGVPYRALDPELVAWVHTSIPFAVMQAYDRYRRPLSVAEKDRYLAEQAVVGLLSGAEWVPTSTAELADYLERMRPVLAYTEQTRAFVDFLAGDTDVEGVGVGPLGQLQKRLDLASSMALLPVWARHLSGTYLPAPVERAYRLVTQAQVGLVGWAYPELPCKAMAMARATGAAGGASRAA